MPNISCPCCGAEIEIIIDPGEPTTPYLPDGSGYPGSPATIEQTIGCDCWEYLDGLFSKRGDYYDSALGEYEDKLLELAVEEE